MDFDYQIGQAVTVGGRSPEDNPQIGEVRALRDGATGIEYAWFRVERIQPPINGSIPILYGRICKRPDEQES